MAQLISEIVPLGVAVAASPFPVIPSILLLFTPRARATGSAFLAGWIVGVMLAAGVFVVLATVVQLADEPPAWATWTRIVLGAVLIALGLGKWIGSGADSEQPAWMRSIDALTPSSAFRLAFLLSAANPKIVLIAAAAGLAIGSAELGGSEEVLALVVFTVIAASTVALPLVLHAVFGDRVLEPLGNVRDWLQVHNATVMSVVLLVIGAAVLLKGLSGV